MSPPRRRRGSDPARARRSAVSATAPDRPPRSRPAPASSARRTRSRRRPRETARDGWLEFLVKVDGIEPLRRASSTACSPAHAIRVEGPAGNFAAAGRSPTMPLLFIAGGTGIAPLRSMILERIHARHAATARAGLLGAHARTSSPTWTSCAGSPTTGSLALTLTLTGDAEDWAPRARPRRRAHLSDLVDAARRWPSSAARRRW